MLLTRTKIIATVGPAMLNGITSWDEYEAEENEERALKAKDIISNVIKNGARIFRLNLSHGTHELHKFSIELIRSIADELNINVDFLADTKGPEIRVNEVEQNTVIKKNQMITIYTQKKIVGNYHSFSVYDENKKYNMIDDIKVNQRILVDDGKLILVVLKINKETNEIIAEAMNQHTLKTNKRINLPDSNYSIPFISERDVRDVLFAIENEVFTIALSFLSNVDQLKDLRKLINYKYLHESVKPPVEFIAKIETKEAINNIDSLLEEVQGVMIARGDLGLEIPYYEVPHFQQEILDKATKKNKIAIVATQMLDSLESSILPTRAEVNDVYTAVMQKATSVMLSGETAAGHNPANAVEKMGKIVLEAEKRIELNYSTEEKEKMVNEALELLPKSTTNQELFKNFAKVFKSDKTSKTKNKLYVFNVGYENQIDVTTLNFIKWPATFLYIVNDETRISYIPLNPNENYLYHNKPIINIDELNKLVDTKEYEVWFL